MIKQIFRLAVAFLVVAAPVKVLADSVIVGGNAGAYPPGTVVPAGQSINLGAEESIDYLEKGGSLQSKAGPFDGVIDGGGGGGTTTQVIAELMKSGRNVKKLGAMRSQGLSDGPAVDLELEGVTFCVAPGLKPMLRMTEDTVDRIVILEGPVAVEVAWAASVAELSWPSGAPLTDNTDYIALVDDLDVGSFTVRLVKPEGNLGQRVQILAEAGCKAQALEELNKAVEPK